MRVRSAPARGHRQLKHNQRQRAATREERKGADECLTTTKNHRRRAGATDYGYVSSGNTAGNVRLIKNYALFLFPKGDSTFVAPTGVAWTPPASKKPIGYSTEDAPYCIRNRATAPTTRPTTATSCCPTRIRYWTLQLAAMEGRKDVVSAYFDVDVDSDGGISIKGAGLKKEWILVLVALDQQDRPFLLYGTNAKVSDRDDVSLKSSEIMNFSMTFKMLKGTNGEQFHAWGLVTEDAK